MYKNLHRDDLIATPDIELQRIFFEKFLEKLPQSKSESFSILHVASLVFEKSSDKDLLLLKMAFLTLKMDEKLFDEMFFDSNNFDLISQKVSGIVEEYSAAKYETKTLDDLKRGLCFIAVQSGVAVRSIAAPQMGLRYQH